METSRELTSQSAPIRAAAACLLLVLAGSASASPGAAPATSEAIARVERGLLPPVVIERRTTPMEIGARMAFYGVPGVSVAVIDGGELAWAKGYGVLEAGGTRPVTVDSLFQAASISKAVTAVAALSLVQRGRVTLDEDVNDRLHSWKVPQNGWTRREKVTLRRLVSHNAGATVDNFRGYAAGEPVPGVLQILSGGPPANSPPVVIDTIPGSGWRYSGGGFVVIQLLMSDVTGKPFPSLMRELVLDPLGMSSSTFEQPLPVALQRRAAAGHDQRGRTIPGRWFTYPELAAAGLWTTPSDLASVALELQRARAGRSRRTLSREMAGAMLSKQAGEWGLGVRLLGTGPQATFSHFGANEGFQCNLVAFLESGQGAVIMTNGERGGPLINEILRGIAREYHWPALQAVARRVARVDREMLREYAGEYALRDGVKVTLEGGGLFITPANGTKAELLPSSDHEFFLAAEDITVTFIAGPGGKIDRLEVRFPDHAESGRKVPSGVR